MRNVQEQTDKITLEKIDLSTHEGKLLQAALVILTTKVHPDRTPDEVIQLLYLLYESGTLPESAYLLKPNPNDLIGKLAGVIVNYYPNEIGKGGIDDNPVDAAIRLLIPKEPVAKTTYQNA